MKLFNSAVMPQEGKYEMKKITAEEFKAMVKDALSKGKLESYIGIAVNLKFLKALVGENIPFKRAKAELEPGEQYLVMRLKRDVKRTRFKRKVDLDSFEYLVVKYKNGR